MNLNICLSNFHFLRKWYRRRALNAVTEDFAHGRCSIGNFRRIVLAGQSLDGFQRIVQEMRIDLTAQVSDLGLLSLNVRFVQVADGLHQLFFQTQNLLQHTVEFIAQFMQLAAAGQSKGVAHFAALPLMEKGSELGNASATTTLANMYYFGYGVKKDDVRAEQYLILAHEQGNVNATIYLGDRYLAGDFPGGVEKAADWYRKAVELGREDAQEKLNALAGIPADAALLQSLEETVASGKFDETHLAQLGKMYLDGVPGVVRADPAKAFAVLSKVEQVERKIQDGTAYALLARMYENGEGTQKDLAKAGAYYLDAAYFDNGLPYAEKAADIFEQLGDVKQELRALKRAMALGCTDLHKQFDLGNLYYTGEATGAPDYATAKKYFDLAAGQNECNALAYLGNMYYLGYGVEQNYALAEDYYTRSHYAGHSAIAGYMVQYYSSGVFPGGVAKVLEWQRICAEQGHYSAVEYMAKACVEGVRDENGNVILEADYSAALPLLEHVYNNDATNGYLVSWYGYLTEYPPEGQPDYARALEIYKDGYALGDGFSASALGKFYANGLGVEVDLEKARTYYQKAVELGYTQAQDELDKLSR